MIVLRHRWHYTLVLFLGLSGSVFGQKVQQVVPEKTRILFVLDASGSMEAKWNGNQSKIDIAKEILTRLVDSLRVNEKLELALRVYGHRYTRQANNCTDSFLEIPFGPKNHNSIVNKIKGIKPKGVTPITYSLSQAANDFPNSSGYRNILILITDGVESCGGDPCAASVELQRKGVFLRPYIIGLGLEGGKVLDCVGKYIDAQNARSLNNILNKSIETSLAKTTVTVELLNGSGKPTETNTDITFRNAMTKTPVYEFVHYRDRLGRPDTVQIDPVVSYDIVVNTLPSITVKDVAIQPGSHTVINIPAPQGQILGRTEGRGNGFAFIVREKGKSQLLNQQRTGEPYKYLQGDYEIETLTLPRRIIPIQLKADELQTFSLPATGLVNINTLTTGIGSIFEISESGETTWVCNLEETSSQHSYNLLPGKYKVAFRARDAKGSKYTGTKNFEVKSGQTVNFRIFN